ncbi:MAG: hypothetical protein EPN97_00195 [Alphaproteobacteria bacterium]|nr:MAG: hypothetical protein EPN97_00195 [Alphaproteobacteria bacterium]
MAYGKTAASSRAGEAAAFTKRLDTLRARLRRLLPGFIRRLLSHLERDTRDPWKILRLTIRLSALGIAAPMLLTYDFWFQDSRLYQPSPIVPALSSLPHAVNAAMYFFTIACCTVIFLFPSLRRLGFLLLPVFCIFVLQDQTRGHFYYELSLFNLLAGAAIPRKVEDRHLDPLRYMTIGIYFWAGFYKLNAFFVLFGFPWFVSTWFPFTQVAQVVGFLVPFLEAAVGVFLLFPATRWIGQALAFSMLVVVLLSLGPFGLNQAMVVWPANVYLDCLTLFLFSRRQKTLADTKRVKRPLAALAALVFCAVPALGMVDLLGVHPSFKLYCSCGYEASVFEFGPRENLGFLHNALAETAVKDDMIGYGDVTYSLLNVPPCNFLPGEKPIIAGFRGFCPHLSKPHQARLRVVRGVHFWSTDFTENAYDICGKEPRLLYSGPPR